MRIRDAGGGVTRGQQRTAIEINSVTGGAGPATVANIQDSLEGTGKYADQGYVVVQHPDFDGITVHPKEDVTIDWSSPPVRTAWLDPNTKLYRWELKAPLPPEQNKWLQCESPTVNQATLDEHLPEGTTAIAHNVYELPSICEAIRFMHAVCGFPAKSTWIKAIRNKHYVGWPLLTVMNVHKHYPETVQTPRGHLNQSQAGIRSTKTKVIEAPLPEPAEDDVKRAFNVKERDVFVKIIDTTDTVHSDQTGKYPVRSRSGYNYIMVMCHVDTAAALAEPMKNRTAKEMIRAYRALLARIRRAGFVVRKHILDNECSAELKEEIRETCKLQLVPPGSHRANIAEVTIKAFKQHFISIRAGMAADFPQSFWDMVLPQILLTLNLLRKSHSAPTVSAHAHFCGQHDYNAQPLQPIGQSAEVFIRKEERKSWGYHSRPAWYLYTSPEHYRTHMFLLKDTKTLRLSDASIVHTKNLTTPKVTHGDRVVQAASGLSAAVGNYVGKRGRTNENMEDLKNLVEACQRLVERNNDASAAAPTPVLRVPALAPAPTDAPRAARTRATPQPGVPAPRPATRAALRETPRTRVPATQSALADEPRDPRPRVATANEQQPTERPMTTTVPKRDKESLATSQTVQQRAIDQYLGRQNIQPLIGPEAEDVATETTSTNEGPVASRTRAKLQPPPSWERAEELRRQRLETAQTKRTPVPPCAPVPTGNEPIARRTRSQVDKVSPLEAALHTVLALDNTSSRAQAFAGRRLPRAVFSTALAVMCADTGDMLKYRDLISNKDPAIRDAWQHSAANEFGRLFQGIGGRIKDPTNTCAFIRKEDVPEDRFKDVTYGKFECSVRPQKVDEPLRTRLTVGGNRINYTGEVGTPTAEMLLVKVMLNSVVSTPGAKFMTTDISDFYLATPLKRKEYLKLSLRDIPQEVIDEYNLEDKAINGFVYVEISRGMYGLPQSGLLANELLEARLGKHGYRQSTLVPGLWKHDWRPIQFTLVVDDFGVKYVGQEHAIHLEQAIIKSGYRIKSDWAGTKYVGITLDWDYDRRQVHLSMPGYGERALTRFQHEAPRTRQDSPHPHTPPNYGAKQQFVKDDDSSAPLDAKGQKFIQQITGTFLFEGRAVNSPLLVPLSSLSSEQAKPTETTLNKARQLLDYIASQEDPILTYHASDMILAAHADASYLSEPQARSRAGGHIFLSKDVQYPPNNGAILNIAQIIKNVMSSATEAEIAALYIVARECVYIRIILEEMGHAQPPTPIQTDNMTAEGVVNSKVQPKRTKAMDMRFHWLRDRETLRQFRFYWRSGKLNLADYFTKHHPAAHHRTVRGEFLTSKTTLDELRTETARLNKSLEN